MHSEKQQATKVESFYDSDFGSAFKWLFVNISSQTTQKKMSFFLYYFIQQ